MAERKRVTLHPLKSDGNPDLDINLYPKTFLDGIVDRDGHEVTLPNIYIVENVQTLSSEFISKLKGGDIVLQYGRGDDEDYYYVTYIVMYSGNYDLNLVNFSYSNGVMEFEYSTYIEEGVRYWKYSGFHYKIIHDINVNSGGSSSETLYDLTVDNTTYSVKRGTKLYSHTINLENGVLLYIISTRDTPYTAVPTELGSSEIIKMTLWEKQVILVQEEYIQELHAAKTVLYTMNSSGELDRLVNPVIATDYVLEI